MSLSLNIRFDALKRRDCCTRDDEIITLFGFCSPFIRGSLLWHRSALCLFCTFHITTLLCVMFLLPLRRSILPFPCVELHVHIRPIPF